ncbi:MAG: hypothetical protein AAFR26_03475 [Cyanobacteria bacterium J06626_4]
MASQPAAIADILGGFQLPDYPRAAIFFGRDRQYGFPFTGR